MKWLSEHIKTAVAIFTMVGSIVGFIIGLYVSQLTLKTEIQALKHKQEQDYEYTMKMMRASGAYYLPLEE